MVLFLRKDECKTDTTCYVFSAVRMTFLGDLCMMSLPPLQFTLKRRLSHSEMSLGMFDVQSISEIPEP